MGISNKLATKVRTAAKTEVVPLPRPYEDAGAIVAAAVVRAAASTIGQLKLSSSTARGKDFLGINQARRSYVSTVSVVQVNQYTWSIMLGVLAASGWAVDWKVQLVLADAQAGVTANITTPQTLTLDGTLVNKSAHGELRDLLLSGLRAGQLPGGAAEVVVSRAALAAAQPPPVYASVAGLTMRTKLRPEEILAALGTVPFPVAERWHGGLRWRLDTAGPLARCLADASLSDDGAVRTLTLRCPSQPAGGPVADAMAAQRGVALFDAAIRAVGRLDPGVEHTRETVNNQRPTAHGGGPR